VLFYFIPLHRNGSRQCRSKSNIAEKSAIFYNFCAALLILHMAANSVQDGQFCACRIAEFRHSYFITTATITVRAVL